MIMNYVSTRDKSVKVSAAKAIAQGISVEGGLFVPDTFPTFTADDFRKLSQLTVIPKTFKVDIPQELALEALKCKTDEEANALGVEWCINQCKELIKFGVPSIHFYTVGAVDSIKQVAKAIY